MSSKTFRTATNYYLDDSANVSSGIDGDPTAAWQFSGTADAKVAITDQLDSTYWWQDDPSGSGSQRRCFGSLQLSENLAAQIPWNSTVTSVTVGYRYRLQLTGGTRRTTPYTRRNQGVGSTARYGTEFTPPSDFAYHDQTETFTTDTTGAAWTFTTFYTDTYIGVRLRISDAPGTRSFEMPEMLATVIFTLPVPTVTTGAASSVGGTAATLNGTVNANHTFSSVGTDGYPVTVTAEWGTTTAYGNTESAGTATGGSATPFAVPLIGLTPNTTYHYRFKATDGDNTVLGSDMSFIAASGDPVLMSS